MTKYKEPLNTRENKKDEEVRRASNPALAYNNTYAPTYYTPTYYAKRTKDLTGRPIDQPDAPITRRKGTHSPMSNEGPSHRWPTDKDYKK